MTTIVHRYVVKEQIVPLGICFLGLCFVLTTGRLLQLTRYLFTSTLTLADLVELMTFAVPKLILYALPMATLIGVLLAFVRLNSDNELIAFRAAGIAFRQFLPPVLFVLLLMTALSFYNTFYIIPSANKSFADKLESLGRASLPVLLKEGIFIDTIPNIVFFFESVNASDLSIEGIFVQDQRQSEVRLAIVAERAQIMFQQEGRQLTFRIWNGIITRVPDDLEDAQAVSFKAYDLLLSLDEIFGTDEGEIKDRKEMTLRELQETIRQGGQDFDVRYSMEFHQRLALPLSCMMLGLVGAPLGALFRQRSRMTGITLGLGLFLAYYVVLSAGKGMGENSLVPAGLAIWMPNLLTLLAAVYLWVKVERETPFTVTRLWERLQAVLRRIGEASSSHKKSKKTT